MTTKTTARLAAIRNKLSQHLHMNNEEFAELIGSRSSLYESVILGDGVRGWKGEEIIANIYATDSLDINSRYENAPLYFIHCQYKVYRCWNMEEVFEKIDLLIEKNTLEGRREVEKRKRREALAI